jgi:hypothetical protein
MLDRKKLAIEDGSVVITGRYKGQDVTLTGRVSTLEVEHDEPEFDISIFDKMQYHLDTPVWLRLTHDPAEGHLYKIKLNGHKVRKTVTTSSPNMGPESIEQARKRVGAPQEAVWSYVVTKKEVIFHWEEVHYE